MLGNVGVCGYIGLDPSRVIRVRSTWRKATCDNDGFGAARSGDQDPVAAVDINGTGRRLSIVSLPRALRPRPKQVRALLARFVHDPMPVSGQLDPVPT